MLNVQLIRKTNFEAFTMVQETVNEKGVQNVLLITDSGDAQKYWESKNVRVELIRSIDDSVIKDLYPQYGKVDTIIITSPKLIARYYNETVNVKVNKAKDLFTSFNSNIYILSDYANVSSIVSHSSRTDSLHEDKNHIKSGKVKGNIRNAKLRK